MKFQDDRSIYSNSPRRKNNFSSFVVDLRSPRKKDEVQAQLAQPESKRRANKGKRRSASSLFNFSILKKLRLGPDFLSSKEWRQSQAEKFSWRHFVPHYLLPSRLLPRRRKGFLRPWSRHRSSFVNLYLRSAAKHFKVLNSRVPHIRISRVKDQIVVAPHLFHPVRRNKRWWEIFYFIIILLVLVVPFKVMSYYFDLDALKSRILSRSQSGVSSFLAGADRAASLDWSGANSEFSAAGQKFLAAQSEAEKINNSLLSLASLSSNPEIKMAAESKKLLAAGSAAASLGKNLSLALDSLFNNPQQDIAKILENFSYYGGLAERDLKQVSQNLSAVKISNLPPEYQAEFANLNQQVQDLSRGLGSFISSLRSLHEFLGLNQDKRYLLVFQNNTELRASGGFLGSYALVDIRDGKIKNLEVPGGGSYDTEAGLKKKIVSPAPLWLVNPQWHFWDCNWWPDWPTSAQNIMWFYEKSDGPTVDGVISFTPTVIEDLLKIIGPIDLRQEYGVVVDADNFWENVQTVVETKNQGFISGAATASSSLLASSSLVLNQGLEQNTANKPKKIIGDLMAKILEELPSHLDKDNLIKLLSLSEKNLSGKQILFYFNDPKLQKIVSDHNWAGEMRPSNYDYLAVINTNIAGQKSDRRIKETIDLDSDILSDGSVVNTLTIRRQHAGVKNEIFSGVRNVDWLRVYVPSGSQLLQASGFSVPDASYFSKPEADWEINPTLAKYENIFAVDPASGTKIYQENGKTVFANWTMVDPGEESILTFKYRLPFNVLSRPQADTWVEDLNRWLNPRQAILLPYSLLIQKQAGAAASAFSLHLRASGDWPLVWRYPAASGHEPYVWETSFDLDSDKYFATILKQDRE
ncbi:MAG: DUF4012 domain-containing protein [Patescibacteria group bacterium]